MRLSSVSPLATKPRSIEALRAHYTGTKKAFEALSMLVCAALMVATAVRMQPHLTLAMLPWLFALTVLSLLAADLISGVVHWLADTWGTVEMPIIGATLIRNFREHHVDPSALARGDVLQVYGDNCLIVIPLQVGLMFVPMTSPTGVLGSFFVFSLILWVVLTNQIHQWAHQKQSNVVVRLLMRMNIVLSREKHAQHHRAPFDHSYCITTGWLNPLLNRTRLFRRLEMLVVRTWGLVPRHDDLGLDAAVQVSMAHGVIPADGVGSRTRTSTAAPTATKES